MQKHIRLCLFIVLQCAAMSVFCQHHTTAEESHSSSPHEGKDPGFEAVLSSLFIWSPDHDVVDFATELHLTYWLTHKWALGVGYTLVFEDEGEKGHELAALFSHKPATWVTINVGPSFTMPTEHTDLEVSGYVESEFAARIGDFHTGPTIGVLISDEMRYFGGWHVSYEF